MRHPREPSSMTPPTDPDVDLHVPGQRRELAAHPVTVLGTIAAGGALGALGRFGASTALPHDGTGFPWSTFLVNVVGSLLIGALMVALTEGRAPHPLVRPFLGVGVLGGFTTFSTAMVEFQRLVAAGAARTGLVYLAGTVAAALVAVWAGAAAARLLLPSRRRPAPEPVTAGAGEAR